MSNNSQKKNRLPRVVRPMGSDSSSASSDEDLVRELSALHISESDIQLPTPSVAVPKPVKATSSVVAPKPVKPTLSVVASKPVEPTPVEAPKPLEAIPAIALKPVEPAPSAVAPKPVVAPTPSVAVPKPVEATPSAVAPKPVEVPPCPDWSSSSDSSEPEVPFVRRLPKKKKKCIPAQKKAEISRPIEPDLLDDYDSDELDPLLDCPIAFEILREAAIKMFSSASSQERQQPAARDRPAIQRKETFFGVLKLPTPDEVPVLEGYMKYFVHNCLPLNRLTIRLPDVFQHKTIPEDETPLEARGECCAKKMEVDICSEADLEGKKGMMRKAGLPQLVQYLYVEGQRSGNLISRNYSRYLLTDDVVDGMRPARNAHTKNLNYLTVGPHFDELLDVDNVFMRGGDGTRGGVSIEALANAGLVDPIILKNINRLGIKQFTAIQSVISYLMFTKPDHDIIAQSAAGTGKTAGYLIALVAAVFKAKMEFVEKHRDVKKWAHPSGAPYAIVIVPNRELAAQISCFANELTKGMDKRYQNRVSVAATYGGMDLRTARKHMKSGCDILVGTPQRLLSHFQCGFLTTELLSWAILDETDALLEQRVDTETPIEELLTTAKSNEKTRICTFGGSFSLETVAELKSRWLRPEPFEVSAQAASSSATHYFVELEGHTKRTYLQNFLRVLRNAGTETPKTIIFAESPTKCEFLYYLLHYSGFPCLLVHSNLLQFAREFVLDQFAQGVASILISTDITTRGLNFKDVTYVINYDLPDDTPQYLRRAGRTGRLGNVGTVVTFFELGREREVLRASKLIPGMIDAGIRPASFLYYYYTDGPPPEDVLRDLQEYEKRMAALESMALADFSMPESHFTDDIIGFSSPPQNEDGVQES
uniref:ATP-dependent RNA helicase n=1 Tax=Steinernema glaseri TaxID=37863 RepID=A0A1I7YJF6_9BILA